MPDNIDFRKLSPQAQARLRRLAVEMVAAGQTRLAVAEAIGVNRRFVGKWVHNFQAGGYQALAAQSRGRRPGFEKDLLPEMASPTRAVDQEPIKAASPARPSSASHRLAHGATVVSPSATPDSSPKGNDRAVARPVVMGQATMLQEVADAAGVHRSTASRALNPQTAHMLSADVTAKVIDIAAKLGYRRNLLAASMRTNRTHLVGILVPDLANPLFAPILAGAEATLAEHGYAVLVANARAGETREILGLVDDLVARRAEGMILATARDGDPVLAHCIALGLPTVLVNRADIAGRFAAATPNDREGMRIAVRHLIDLGHRNIGHVAGPQDVSTGRSRRDGFIAAMRASGLPVGPIVTADAYTRDAGRAATERLLRRVKRPTAIAAANDLLALGAYQALAAHGLNCPRDVSVTGHNDMALVDMVQPPLTTVKILQDQIGREGARLLLRRIGNPHAELTQVMTQPELMLRASTRVYVPD